MRKKEGDVSAIVWRRSCKAASFGVHQESLVEGDAGVHDEVVLQVSGRENVEEEFDKGGKTG